MKTNVSHNLAVLLTDWVPRQPWFQPPMRARHLEVERVVPRRFEVLRKSWPLMIWTPVEVMYESGLSSHHQVIVGLDPNLPHLARDGGYIGGIETSEGPAHAFDALMDVRLARRMVRHVAPELSVVDVDIPEQSSSNSSVVIDDRFVLKLFRRLEPGANPDIELPEGLGRNGQRNVPVPISVWRKGDTDLAVVRRWHRAGSSGADLAERSLRELMRRRVSPRELQTDFAPSAERLGVALAELHSGLATVFGTEPINVKQCAYDAVVALRGAVSSGELRDGIEAWIRALFNEGELGQQIRIHGDLELQNTLWSGQEWTIVDFEGDLSLPMEMRSRPASPLVDVAAMVQSFQFVASRVLLSIPEGFDREQELFALAWVERATDSFLSGYTSEDLIHRLLPKDRMTRDRAMTTFELVRTASFLAKSPGQIPAMRERLIGDLGRLLTPRVKLRW